MLLSNSDWFLASRPLILRTILDCLVAHTPERGYIRDGSRILLIEEGEPIRLGKGK